MFTYIEAGKESFYTTWNTMDATPDILYPELFELYDNYNDLINETGLKVFLGVKLNAQNQVTNAYACSIKNNIPFCIEGKSDDSLYSTNVAFLQWENLWNNTCDLIEDKLYGIMEVCGDPEIDKVSAYVEISGSVGTIEYIDYNDSGIIYGCDVSSNGQIGCGTY